MELFVEIPVYTVLGFRVCNKAARKFSLMKQFANRANNKTANAT